MADATRSFPSTKTNADGNPARAACIRWVPIHRVIVNGANDVSDANLIWNRFGDWDWSSGLVGSQYQYQSFHLHC